MTSPAWLAVLAVGLVGPIYAIAMALVFRPRAPRRPDQRAPVTVVCLVPCLDEGLVVVQTVRSLVSLGPDVRVLVIDDASTDGTAEMVESLGHPRVFLYRRHAPNARTGKGDALNAGYGAVNAAVSAEGIDPQSVVVAVFDADSEVDGATLDAVKAWFSDPQIGAVQIAVRISNRFRSWLARMQDVEFAGYARIFQGGRNYIGSTGLGGNGQFTRLVALRELGAAPWSDCLTEDLDLGLRMGINGWRSVFDETVAVHQQGLHDGRRLLRQRTRWFQGHLQCWSSLPAIWRSGQRLRAKVDLTIHLLFPAAMLLISIPILAAAAAMFRSFALEPSASAAAMTAGPIVPWWYLAGFLATPLIATAYWRTEPEIGFWKGLVAAHAYGLFTWVWFFAGWRAVYRHALGRAGWAKTVRTQEAPADDSDEIGPGPMFGSKSNVVVFRDRESGYGESTPEDDDETRRIA
ncbi:MAG: glycosyltransferase family 2 protein [Acidimicrobiales bacterium]|nr:glycosyltransferase family 2 protein [Acidimicrobiales bacterium]